jgi:CelD/BcsL family acetyltransferase involved in cellulose biosynthesis
MRSIHFGTIIEARDFRALEPAWNGLFGRLERPHLFQTFAYQWRAWEHGAARRGHELRIVVGRVGDRVVLIWPLVLEDPYLRFLSSGKFEYRDVLVEHSAEADRWIAQAFKVVRRLGGGSLLLDDLRVDSRLGRYLARRHPGCVYEPGRSWLLRLDQFPTWSDYLGQLPKRLMADQRRQWRRLAELSGGVQFRLLTDDDEIAATLRWLMDQKVAWLEARDKSPVVFGSEPYRDFMHSVTLDAKRGGYLFLAVLSSGQTIFSALLGFFHGDTFTFSNFAYDPAFNTYSPSRLILEKSIEWCHAQGVPMFDFQIGEEAYKKVWATEAFDVATYTVPITLQGVLIARWHKLGLIRLTDRAWFRPLYKVVPPAFRTALARKLYSNAYLFEAKPTASAGTEV